MTGELASSRTFLVTGATDGLGRALAARLVADGARVLLHGRDRGRLDATLAELSSDQAGGYLADFSDLDQVAAMADRIADEHPRLDVLVNNAGIGSGPRGDVRRETSVQGHELRFQVNYLAGFLLTEHLEATLRATPDARVVNVASIGQHAIELEDVMLTRGYTGTRAYGQSKLAQIMHALDLADRLRDSGVRANALHPASLMDTKMVRETFGASMSTVEDGLRATLRLVVPSNAVAMSASGQFYNGEREARPDPQAYDAHVRQELRALSLRLIAPHISRRRDS